MQSVGEAPALLPGRTSTPSSLWIYDDVPHVSFQDPPLFVLGTYPCATNGGMIAGLLTVDG